MPRRIQLLLVFGWTALATLSAAFQRGRGFAYEDAGALRWTGDLLSSGGNDDVVILVGVGLGALGAAWAAVRVFIRRNARWPDALVHGALWGVQALYLSLIEVGHFWRTIAAEEGWNLGLWSACFASLLAMLAAGCSLRASDPLAR